VTRIELEDNDYEQEPKYVLHLGQHFVCIVYSVSCNIGTAFMCLNKKHKKRGITLCLIKIGFRNKLNI
jgi:hypothetical protein